MVNVESLNGRWFFLKCDGAPGDWKLERLKHHHTIILVLLLYTRG